MTWVQTYGGRAVDILLPDPSTIHVRDVSMALSRIARFNGHTATGLAYNVAHHSVLVERLMPASAGPLDRLAALLHDGHEAYAGDTTTPVHRAVTARLPGFAAAWGAIQEDLDLAIARAVGAPAEGWLARLAATKHADLRACAVEKRDFMSPGPMPWTLAMPDVSDVHPISEPVGSHGSVFLFETKLRELVRLAGLQPMGSFGL